MRTSSSSSAVALSDAPDPDAHDVVADVGRGADGRVSRLYLIAGGLAIVCYLVAPVLAGNAWLFKLVGLSVPVALALGVAWYRPRPVLPWALFLAGQLLFLVGDVLYYTFDPAFPSVGDGFYLAYYPLLAAGLFLLIRARNPESDSASLLDALIITVGFGLLSWVFLIQPYTHFGDESMLSRIVSMSYPTMDMLLLAVIARMVFGNGTRPRALNLMAASVLCLIITDAAYVAIELNGSYDAGGLLDAGWMATYILWGAAALHPSMRDLSVRAPAAGASLSGKRVWLLAAATLIAPATLVVDSLWPVDGFSVPVSASVSAVLFVLVLFRMLGLLSSLRDAVGRHQRAERRERILRRAATSLTAATDREQIRRAGVNGARDLVRGLADIRISVEMYDDREPQDDVTTRSVDSVVVPLATQAAGYGRLLVSGSAPVPSDVVDGLHTLGAQVALALESAALTDGLTRQRSESRVGALVQNSSDVIMVLDDQLVIRYVTPSVTRVMGHEARDVLGVPLLSLTDPSERAAVTDFYALLQERAPESARAEWRMRCGDGHYTDVETVSADLLRHPSVNGIVVTARDISERKTLEAGLQRHILKLEELDRLRSDFVATVSHELRTPLTSIIGEVEMIEDGDYGVVSGRQSQSLEVIGRNSERLLKLIEDLLTLNHVETGAVVPRREPTPVLQLLDGVRSQVERAATAKSVELTLTCSEGVDTVDVDREQLDRALLNLLTNAVKFTPSGGTVALQAQRVAADLVITVADTGVGIPEDEQEGLFTRFFRSSVATDLAIPGTGLGLVIVKQIVEEHGGTIAIASAPDEGTTVTVTIPADDHPGLRTDAA